MSDEQVMHDNVYTNTYSLWGNSKYYDIKNLSPQNFANRNGTIGSEISREFKASKWSSSPSEVQATPEPPDSRHRRTVDRESLYEDPDTFHRELNEEGPAKSPAFEWTQLYWHKASEKLQEGANDGAPGPSRVRKPQVVGANKIQKKLDKLLAKPVKMTKAESMMQKMGWQGGALGRSGDGIVEPIAPNAVYAKTKIGFGQNHILKPPKNKKADSKHFYEMNVLLNIYEFVKNNSEVELLFDKKLKKDERKQIHQLVQFKLNVDDLATVDFHSTAQMDLVLQISDKNCYVLQTQSSGAYPHRQLCIYKEAPPHVFLIIPDDLRDEEEEEEPIETQPQTEEVITVEIKGETVAEETELEEETNPFLISITRNLKKVKSDSECLEDSVSEEKIAVEETVSLEKPVLPKEPAVPEMTKVMKLIVEYFNEFAVDKKYSQFKFLGPFSEEEIVAINDFIEQAVKFQSEMECPLAAVFKKFAFEINEDCTGNTVIYKRPV